MIEYGNTLFEDFDLSGYDTTEYKPYLHYFDTNSEFEEEYFGDEYYEPWVSFTSGDSLVHYNKKGPNAPLTFNILSSGTIYWKYSQQYGAREPKTIQYSKDKGQTWTQITATEEGVAIPVSAGDVLWLKGTNAEYEGNCFSGSTAWFTLEGNMMSLIDAENYRTLYDFSSGHTFDWVFRFCTGLTDASRLVLQATGLVEYCYSALFQGCPNLARPPKLMSMTLANNCYQYMFQDCTSLIQAPALPATTLAEECYVGMFYGCTSLPVAPNLLAPIMVRACYNSMFRFCSSLVNPPKISATAITGTYNCHLMFANCTNLKRAPELLPTSVNKGSYLQMFVQCTSLEKAQTVLPATTLGNSCYGEMFANCTSLTKAPELPAETLVYQCYYEMFQNCTNLNYVKCLATDISASICLTNWMAYVQTNSGTFVKNPNMSSWPSGWNGIPNGWTIVNA